MEPFSPVLSHNSHICGHFNYFYANYKASNLCSCPLIEAPTKAACYAQLFTRLRCTDSTAHSSDRTCSKQKYKGFPRTRSPLLKINPLTMLTEISQIEPIPSILSHNSHIFGFFNYFCALQSRQPLQLPTSLSSAKAACFVIPIHWIMLRRSCYIAGNEQQQFPPELQQFPDSYLSFHVAQK